MDTFLKTKPKTNGNYHLGSFSHLLSSRASMIPHEPPMVASVDPVEGNPSAVKSHSSKLYLLHYNVTLKFSFLTYDFDKADGNEFSRDSNGG